MLTLDEVARDPARAARVSVAEKSALLSQCAAIILALSCTATPPPAHLQTDAPPAPRGDELLTIEEVTATLKLSKAYVYELVRRGEIRALHHGRCWRVRPAELERFIAANEKTRT